MSQIRLATLPNGLRVVTDTVKDVESVALGIWINVGTRHENMEYNGAAHLVEHMMFKGTTNRSAQEIVEVIESAGGNFNAYTSREITSYHIHLLKDDVPLGLDVLADLLQNPTMPEDELERERGVILQEIGMTEDTPDDLVFDHYYETAFPGQALGAPILGRAEIIKKIQRETLMDHVRRFYTPARTVISAAGNLDHDVFVKMVSQLFAAMPTDVTEPTAPATYTGGDRRTEKELEQSHVVLGFRGLARPDPDYYAAQALSALLGGGMSSRLFQEVREKRGLVYSIFSFHSSYVDDGVFGIYAGTGPKDLPELIPVVCDEIAKVVGGVTSSELARAKTQIRADMLMARESMMSRANQQAKYLLFFGQALDVQALMNLVDEVDLKAISRVAARIFSTSPTLAALGPLKKLESYDKIVARFKRAN